MAGHGPAQQRARLPDSEIDTQDMAADQQTLKTIDIEDVRPGMFVERLDRSWITTPFMRHRFLLRDEEDVALLKRYGIRRVIIDTSKSVEPSIPSSNSPSSTDARSAPSMEPSPIASVPPQALASAVATSVPVAASPGLIEHADAVHPAMPPDVPAQRTSAVEPPSREQVRLAADLHAETVVALERMFAGTTGRVDRRALLGMIVRIGERLSSNRHAALAAVRLQQLRRLDHNLFAHAVDVSVLALAVGHEQGLSASALEELALGALLHDIGEVRLPRNLLRKPGAFADHERELMMHHPALGVALLQDADVSDTVRRIVREHHERLDGSGYPGRLSGDAIAAESQLVGLIDVYDALVTSRGPRPAVPPPQAIRRLYQLGLARQFDTRLVEQVIQCLGVYPIGSLVQLTTGERAVVIAGNRQLTVKPTLKLIADAKGRLYPKPKILDLAGTEAGVASTAILRGLDPVQEHYEVALYLEGVA